MGRTDQPKVKSYASTPASRNAISNCPVGDLPRLADQLVHPLLAHHAVAFGIDVAPVRIARWLPVDAHPEPHRRIPRRRAHDEIHVAGMEAVGNPPVGRVQRAARPPRPTRPRAPTH